MHKIKNRKILYFMDRPGTFNKKFKKNFIVTKFFVLIKTYFMDGPNKKFLYFCLKTNYFMQRSGAVNKRIS